MMLRFRILGIPFYVILLSLVGILYSDKIKALFGKFFGKKSPLPSSSPSIPAPSLASQILNPAVGLGLSGPPSYPVVPVAPVSPASSVQPLPVVDDLDKKKAEEARL